MPNKAAITLHAAGLETASGATTPAVDIGELRKLVTLRTDVTEITGTLTIAIETSSDDVNYRVARTLTPITAIASVESAIPEMSRYVRARWTLSAGGSAKFSVGGDAHVIYANPDDLPRYSVPAAAIANTTADEKGLKLLAASSRADDDLSGAYQLPLTAWSESLRMYVAQMAGWMIMKQRGADPNGKDASLAKSHDEAIAWLKQIAEGNRRPIGIEDSTAEVNETSAYVETRESRGWLS